MKVKRVMAATVAALLVLAACGGDDGDADDAAPDDETTSSTTAPEETPVAPTSVSVGTTVFWGGFAITVDEAAGDDGLLTVTGTAENVGEDQAPVPDEVRVDTGGSSATLDFGNSELPDVPGGTTSEFTWAFAPDEEIVLEEAVLVVGDSGAVEASIPLDGTTDPVTLEPTEIDMDGAFTANRLDFEFESAEVRFDRPDNHSAAEEGKAFLHVTYAVTFNGTPNGPRYAFGQEEIRLHDADDVALSPVEFSIELLPIGGTVTDLFAVFEIDSDAPGTYRLVGEDINGGEGELPIEIPELTAT